MSRESRRRIADENREIMSSGFYLYNNEKRDLKLSLDDRMKVEVYSPERIERIVSECPRKSLYNITKVEVNEKNSFEASYEMKKQGGSVLVLSFANANMPGGGFLKGANAHEEVLCRQSSLYQSISNPDAGIMYKVNSSRVDYPTDSDYMLISPKVEVFRLSSGDYIYESFVTSVLSLPAPNVRGKASKLSDIELSMERRSKLRKAFRVAHHAGYETLILGPWGCGAYGNEAFDVARDMEAVLIGERLIHLFKNVVFAVHDTKPEKPNYAVFSYVFQEGFVELEEFFHQNSTDREADFKQDMTAGLVYMDQNTHVMQNVVNTGMQKSDPVYMGRNVHVMQNVEKQKSVSTYMDQNAHVMQNTGNSQLKENIQMHTGQCSYVSGAEQYQQEFPSFKGEQLLNNDVKKSPFCLDSLQEQNDMIVNDWNHVENLRGGSGF